MIKYPKLCKGCEIFIMTPIFKEMTHVAKSLGDGSLSEPVEVKRHPLCPDCEPKYTKWADSIHERVNK